MKKIYLLALCCMLLAGFISCNHAANHRNAGSGISLREATELTHKFKDSVFGNLYEGNTRIEVPLSETFDKASLLDLLQQDTCSGLRIYLGMDNHNAIHFVLVGTGPEGYDIIGGVSF
jgi:hypothetical protein